MDQELSKLIKNVNNSDTKKSTEAGWVLEKYVETHISEDILVAFSNENDQVKRWIASGLANAAFKGLDISLLARYLEEALFDQDSTIVQTVARALTWHYAKRNQWDKLQWSLRSGFVDVKIGVTSALVVMLDHELDISELVPGVVDLLADGEYSIRGTAANVLAKYYFVIKKDIEKSFELLKHDNAEVKRGCVNGLTSLARLEQRARPILEWINNSKFLSFQ